MRFDHGNGMLPIKHTDSMNVLCMTGMCEWKQRSTMSIDYTMMCSMRSRRRSRRSGRWEWKKNFCSAAVLYNALYTIGRYDEMMILGVRMWVEYLAHSHIYFLHVINLSDVHTFCFWYMVYHVKSMIAECLLLLLLYVIKIC